MAPIAAVNRAAGSYESNILILSNSNKKLIGLGFANQCNASKISKV